MASQTVKKDANFFERLIKVPNITPIYNSLMKKELYLKKIIKPLNL